MSAAATAQGKTVGADFAAITLAELDAIANGGEYSKPDATAGETVGVEYFQLVHIDYQQRETTGYSLDS